MHTHSTSYPVFQPACELPLADCYTAPRTYTPDPRNGEVWVPEGEGASCQYVNGEWVETPCGFSVIHMSSGGGSAGREDGFATLEEARAAAVRIARERNAVLS